MGRTRHRMDIKSTWLCHWTVPGIIQSRETSRRYVCLHWVLNDSVPYVHGYTCVFQSAAQCQHAGRHRGQWGAWRNHPNRAKRLKTLTRLLAVSALGSQQSSSCCPHLPTRPCNGPAATSPSQKVFSPGSILLTPTVHITLQKSISVKRTVMSKAMILVLWWENKGAESWTCLIVYKMTLVWPKHRFTDSHSSGTGQSK